MNYLPEILKIILMIAGIMKIIGIKSLVPFRMEN